MLKSFGLQGQIPSAPLPEDIHDLPKCQQPPEMFITGVGSIMTIHFTGPSRDVWQSLFYHHMLSSKIYVAQRGFIALSIEIDQQHIDHFVSALEKFVEKWQSYLK